VTIRRGSLSGGGKHSIPVRRPAASAPGTGKFPKILLEKIVGTGDLMAVTNSSLEWQPDLPCPVRDSQRILEP